VVVLRHGGLLVLRSRTTIITSDPVIAHRTFLVICVPPGSLYLKLDIRSRVDLTRIVERHA
jgi:hypothetical protein